MPKPISYFTRAPENDGEPTTPDTARPYDSRQSSELALAAQQLTLAAQSAASRPLTSVEVPMSHRTTVPPVTPPQKTVPARGGSPFVDPKFMQGRDRHGRKPSAASGFADPEEFYRSGGSSAAFSRSQTPLRMAGVRSRTPMEKYIAEGAKEPKPVSEDVEYV